MTYNPKSLLNLGNATHNMSGTKEYIAWCNIKIRCYDTNAINYGRYGAVGVTVCDKWKHDFDAFLSDVGMAPGLRHTVDRIDNTKGYEPGNVRWATYKQQANNQKSNVRITYNGDTKTIAEWADVTGIAYYSLYQRLGKLGWPIEKALTAPERKLKRTK